MILSQTYQLTCIVGSREKIADVPAGMIALLQESQTESTSNVGAEEDQDELAAVIVWEAIIHPDAKANGESNE